MTSEDIFWERVEAHLGYRPPDIVITVLNNAGFNNEIAISELNSEYISEIETTSNIKLKPGHRAFLLGFSKKMMDFKTQSRNQDRHSAATDDILNSPNVSIILKELLKTAVNNAGVDPKQRRFSKVIKDFAVYLYIRCGRAAYEVLSNNIPLPQPSTILSYISCSKQDVIEGKLRCAELANYLEKLDAPKQVFLSEDGSGIIAKVCFDSSTNQMVGLVLPLDKETGMPISFKYQPNSVADIEQYLKNPKATHIYLVMAQPIKENVPPFVLQIFGTNNKFTYEDVMNRWKYTKNELSKFNIDVCGISSDADSRLLASMKISTKELLGCDPIDSLKKIAGNAKETSFAQDIIHVETKCRNRILKPSVLLPMGKEQVSVTHLKILISTVAKKIHGLVKNDICPEDRQNFRSLQKCFDDRVLNALKENIVGSESTVMYLKICREMYSAFSDPDLEPLERIKRIWHATYFIRAWRVWISSNKNVYSLKNNFLSSQTYSCIELNAYALLHIITKFRKAGKTELFLPMLFSSQTCEHTFRQLRSMTSMFWTRINFNLLELIHMIGRLELSNEIVYDKECTNIIFPREQNRLNKCIVYDLPSNENILKTLNEAKLCAISDAKSLGMNVFSNQINISSIAKRGGSNKTFDEFSDDEIDGDDEFLDYMGVDTDDDSNQHNNLQEERSLENDNFIENHSRFVEIKNSDGTYRTVLKSSVIFALTDPSDSLSKDRLKRVQRRSICPSTPKSSKPSQKRRMSVAMTNNESNAKRRKGNEVVSLANEVAIGDWCCFRKTSKNDENNSLCLLGMVLGFKYIEGSKDKDKQYSLDFVPTSDENTSKRGIEVLSTWKNVDNDFVVNSMSENNSFFVDIKDYIATIKIENSANLNNFKLQLSSVEIQEILSKIN